MFKIAALATLAATATAGPVMEEHMPSFLEYMQKFDRHYADDAEFAKRFENFKLNLAQIEARNAADPSATHGINKFSDLSVGEFKDRFLNAVPRTQEVKDASLVNISGSEFGSGSNVDWRGSSIVTDVKDQGYCGSCWAFSATEQIETNVAMSTGKLLTLAPQQIVSCDSSSYGCNGGWTENAYDYVVSAGGIELESSYPYTSGTAGDTGTCASSSSSFATTISGYQTISSSARTEDQMVTQIATSPMSICVDAETWSSYTGGVVTECGTSVDHCVQVVGYNADSNYWIVRNSWGTSWGDSGYIYVQAGSNTCAIASDATIATV